LIETPDSLATSRIVAGTNLLLKRLLVDKTCYDPQKSDIVVNVIVDDSAVINITLIKSYSQYDIHYITPMLAKVVQQVRGINHLHRQISLFG
jgi:hypothetical protein